MRDGHISLISRPMQNSPRRRGKGGPVNRIHPQRSEGQIRSQGKPNQPTTRVASQSRGAHNQASGSQASKVDIPARSSQARGQLVRPAGLGNHPQTPVGASRKQVHIIPQTGTQSQAAPPQVGQRPDQASPPQNAPAGPPVVQGHEARPSQSQGQLTQEPRMPPRTSQTPGSYSQGQMIAPNDPSPQVDTIETGQPDSFSRISLFAPAARMNLPKAGNRRLRPTRNAFKGRGQHKLGASVARTQLKTGKSLRRKQIKRTISPAPPSSNSKGEFRKGHGMLRSQGFHSPYRKTTAFPQTPDNRKTIKFHSNNTPTNSSSSQDSERSQVSTISDRPVWKKILGIGSNHSKKAKDRARSARKNKRDSMESKITEEPQEVENLAPPEEKLSIFGITLHRTIKLRGRPAEVVRVPVILRMLSSPVALIGTEVFLAVLLIFYNLTVSYLLVYQFESLVGNWILSAIEIVFIVDLSLRLLVEMWRQIHSLDYVIFLIPCSFYYWVCGLIAHAPLSQLMTLVEIDSIETLRLMYALKMFPIIGWYRIFRFFGFLEDSYYIDENTAFLLRYFSFYLAFVHYATCTLFGVTGVTTTDFLMWRHETKTKDAWLNGAYESKPGVLTSSSGNYLLTLELVIVMLTTTGYGSYTFKTEGEMLLAIFVMLVGAIVLTGYFSSALTGFLLNHDGERYQFFHRVDLIVKLLDRLKAPAILTSKIKCYYENLWNFRQGVYHASSLDAVPRSVRDEILLDICEEMFEKSYLLRGLDPGFLRIVCSHVEVLMYNPDTIICLQGESTRAMYFIIQGECVVKTPCDSNEISAILRPKCIFGETSLLFSIPLNANIETRTCCQFLVLHKSTFLNICNDASNEITSHLLRERLERRVRAVRVKFTEDGKYPIEWIRRVLDEEPGNYRAGDYLLTFRNANGMNYFVLPDMLGQMDSITIVDMHRITNTEDPFDTYGKCLMPASMLHDGIFLQFWHPFMAILILFLLMIDNIGFGTWAYSFSHEFLVKFVLYTDYVACFIFFIDIWVEIFSAAPVTGFYYKFWDGINVKRREASFYIDIISIFPVEVVDIIVADGFHLSVTISTVIELGHFLVGRFFKLIKIFRYLSYLDERYPFWLVYLRLVRIAITISVNIVGIAGILYFIACPNVEYDETVIVPLKCTPISWLQSYAVASASSTGVIDTNLTDDTFSNRLPFLVPLLYSAASITGAGFGDFDPQNPGEFVFAVFLAFCGVFLAGYYTAKLTSAIAASNLLRVKFEERLIFMRNLFELHGFSMSLRDRIIEHYRLRYQYHDGVTLPPNVKYLMYDAPPHLSDEALYADMSVILEGVPIFSNADPQVLIALAKFAETYVVPPNINFVKCGDVHRQMYLIYRGSVAVLSNDSSRAVKEILGPTCHFGMKDLIFAEPAFNDITTLSYCVIYAIDYSSYTAIFHDDSDLQSRVDALRHDISLHSMIINAFHINKERAWDSKERKPSEILSWIKFPTKAKPEMNFCTLEEYEDGFKVPCGKFLKVVLMRRTVHPAGPFALAWCLLTAISGLALINLYVFELVPGFLTAQETLVYWIPKLIFLMDIYVRLHWGFYTNSNHLVCHPVLTAKHYLLEGPFLFSLFLELADYALILVIFGAVDATFSGEGRSWITKLVSLRLIYLTRIPEIFRFGRTVREHRTLLLGLIYLGFTVIIATIMALIALGAACNSVSTCIPNFAASKIHLVENLHKSFPRWLVSVYYVLQCILAVGYGDMVSLEKTQIILVIFMVVFGYTMTKFIISDLSAAVLSGDEVRGDYQEKMKRIFTVMKKQRVNPVLIAKVEEHLTHTWYQSKGLQPQVLCSGLHPALQTDLFKEYIGDCVTKVPVFTDANANAIRTLCTYLIKLYFCRGDRIARRDNYEFEMYVIIDGDVLVSKKNKELVCTLGPGESFGETQMMYGMHRRYSAFAATDVEVLALDALSFSAILDHYPGLKITMEQNLRGLRADMFERKVYLLNKVKENLDPEVLEEAKMRISTAIQELDSYETVGNQVFTGNYEGDATVEVIKNKPSGLKEFWRRNVFGWGDSDNRLPFIYFASPTGSTSKIPLLHPKCGLQKWFSLAVLMVSLISPALAFYILVTNDTESPLLEYGLEAIYWVHIILRFFTPFATIQGKYCKEMDRIAYRYVSTLSLFWFHILSSLPFGLIVGLISSDEKLERLLNLLRILRLVHYFRSLNERLEQLTVTTFGRNAVISVTWLGLMAHILACVFYVVAPCGKNEQNATNGRYCKEEGTWTSEFVANVFDNKPSAEDLKPWRWYVRSLYWVITTISTTGFGDIVPVNLNEIAVSIVCMLCGALLLGIILGQLTNGITSLNQNWRKYLYQLNVDVRYLGSLGLSVQRQQALTEWFLLRWHYSRGCSFTQTLSILPLCFRHYISLALYCEILTQVPLFQGLEVRFFTMLASFIDHVVYLPGQIIVHEGDQASHLFIVASGRISGYSLNKHGKQKLVRWYKEGCVFGRQPALFYDLAYTKTYRAEVVSEILTVSKHSVFYLCRFFRDFEWNLEEFIEQTYDPELGVDTIFTPEINPNVRDSKTQTTFQVSRGTAPRRLPRMGRKTRNFRRGRFFFKRQRPERLTISPVKQANQEAALKSRVHNKLHAYDKVVAADKVKPVANPSASSSTPRPQRR